MYFISTILLVFTINNSDVIDVTRPKSPVTDIYLCSQDEMNCQAIIRFLIAHTKESIYMDEGPVENVMIRKALFDANEKNIKIGAIVKSNNTTAINFLIGNGIDCWLDHSTHKTKRFMIFDEKTVVIGPFNFTGKDGNNAEAIEVDQNFTITGVYINEYIKHKNHSTKIEVDEN